MRRSPLLKQNVQRHYPTAVRGDGVYIFDSDGRKYFDACSGAMTAGIGHGVASIAEAVAQQLETLAFSYRTQFTNEPAEELAERLTSLAPGDVNWAFFVNSGSEATEYAIRAAVAYWREEGQPGKVKILGRHISYHGMTMGSLSMSGHGVRRMDYGSLLHAFPVGPPAYPYRYARADESPEEYAERAAREFEAAIEVQDPSTVAAIIVEPIVGAAGGVLVPPPGYLLRLREICDRHEILLIVDEVITGMGRTGDWFASATEGVVPDLLAIGKGMSAGYSPIAAVLLSDRVVSSFEQGSGVPPFGHTFSGNPGSTRACLAVLDFMEDNNVLENARERGHQIHSGLTALADKYPFIADVRGRGLLWGFEFVNPDEMAAHPRPPVRVATRFTDLCFERGLIVYPAGVTPLDNAVLLCPPLTITAGEVDVLLGLLDGCLEIVQEATWWRSPTGS